MTAATLKRMLVVLAVLVFIWFALSLIHARSRDTLAKFTLPRFDEKAIDAMTITHGSEVLTFVKNGTDWTVNGYPTAPSEVGELLAAAADTTAIGELVAEHAESYPKLGVDSLSAHRLTLSVAGKSVLSVFLGGQSQDKFDGFVRVSGQTNVYQLRGHLTNLAGKTLDNWRDKRLLVLNPDDIQGFEITRGQTSFTATRHGNAWSLGSARGDSAAMFGVINLTKLLQANGFATAAQADSANFNKPERVLRLLGDGGKLIASLTFDSMSHGFWVKRDGNPLVYRMDTWLVEALTPDAKSLKQN